MSEGDEFRGRLFSGSESGVNKYYIIKHVRRQRPETEFLLCCCVAIRLCTAALSLLSVPGQAAPLQWRVSHCRCTIIAFVIKTLIQDPTALIIYIHTRILSRKLSTDPFLAKPDLLVA